MTISHKLNRERSFWNIFGEKLCSFMPLGLLTNFLFLDAGWIFYLFNSLLYLNGFLVGLILRGIKK